MKEIIKYNNAVPSFTESLQIGKVFFESGMFNDLKSASQAVTKILAGLELGISPFSSISGIHVINGKPVLGAGIIASRIKSSGKYDYKCEITETSCSIDFFENGKFIGNSIFTIEQAKKAGTKNIEKFPRNMLFARAISNGVKWYCPDIFVGSVYVPEEMEGLQEADEISGEVEQGTFIDPDYFFKEKFPSFYRSWELISTKEQLDKALENLKNNPKWSDKLETQIFKDLLQRKMDQINQVIDIEKEEESVLPEALFKLDNSTSRTELEIHKESFINSLNNADRAIFMKKYQDKYELLPSEKTDIQVSGSTPVFETEDDLMEYATVNANKDGQ